MWGGWHSRQVCRAQSRMPRGRTTPMLGAGRKPVVRADGASAAPPPRSQARRHIPRSSIMNVGKRVDYAIRALCYLAAQAPERVVRRAEIQERQNIPPHFLSKILRALVGAGLLASVPGAHGGFRLGRPARD